MKTVIRRATMALGAFVGVGSLFADTFVWTGAEDAYWTNAANWEVEKVGGGGGGGGGGEWVVASRCPGSVFMDDEDAQWTAVVAECDTAIFDGTGVNPTLGYIDLTGHFAISNVLFRGATAPVYHFGKPVESVSWNAQRLSLRHGAVLAFASDLGAAPVFENGLSTGAGLSTSIGITFVNDSSVDLNLGPYTGYPHLRTTPDYVNLTYLFEGSGTGGVVIQARENRYYDGTVKSVFQHLQFYQRGKVRFEKGISTIIGITYAPPAGETMEVETAENAGPGIYMLSSAAYTVNGNVHYSGDGYVAFGERNYQYDRSIRANVATGSTLAYDGVEIRRGNNVQSPTAGWNEFWITHDRSASRLGTIRFTNISTNQFTGFAFIDAYETVETDSIGTNGVAGAFGTGPDVRLDNSTLRYIGPGETTLKTIILTNRTSTAGAVVSTLAQAGTGTWTVSSVENGTQGAATLVLSNGTAETAILAADLTDGLGALSLRKTGSGTWRLAGTNGITGDTTVEQGTLAIDRSQTIGSLVVAGDATLSVADGVTLTLPSLTRTSGTLDVQTSGTGKLVLSNESFGLVGSWLTVNGTAAVVQADGSLAPLDHNWVTTVDIPAKGGVIPNTVTARDAVGITAAGTTGAITIEDATGATLAGLVQKTATPATVHLDAGQDLNLSLLAVQAGAKNLTVGDSDDGTLSAPNGTLTIDANESTADLVIRTPLAAAVTKILKIGAGLAQVPVGDSSAFDFEVGEGALALARASSALVAESADATGTFKGSASVASETLTLAFDESTVAPVVATGAVACAVALQNKAADLVLSNVTLTVANSTIGGSTAADDADAVARLTLTNSVLDGGTTAELQVGNVVTGVLTVEGDSAITNNVTVIGGLDDNGAGGYGAIYHRGGATRISTLTVGRKRYGYLEVSGGTVSVSGYVNVGETGGKYTSHVTGCGIIAVYEGGTFDNGYVTYQGIGSKFVSTHPHYRETVDRGQSHEIYVKNGTYAIPVGTRHNCSKAANIDNLDCFAGRAVFTVNGPKARVIGHESSGICIGAEAGGRGAALNIINGASFGTAVFSIATKAEGPMFVNFNNGTFHYWSGNVGHLNFGKNDCRAVVYGGGMSIKHINHWNSTLAGPFHAAPGNGLAAVDCPADVRAMEFLGSPFVEIEGDGTGALAFAEFDSRTRHVTQIVVTCPGYNYTWAKAHLVMPEAVIGEGLVTNRADIACTLAPNTRGPFTYYGISTSNGWRDMTLHLTTSNEFGSVVVKNGTLYGDVPNAVPEDGDVVIEAGALDLTTNALRFASLSMAGGTLRGLTNALGRLEIEIDHPGTNLASAAAFAHTNGTAVAADIACVGAWTLDAADLLEGQVATSAKDLTFKPSASVAVTDVDQLDASRRYTLLRFTNGATGTGLPTVTDSALAQAGWRTRQKGSEILFYSHRSVAILIR